MNKNKFFLKFGGCLLRVREDDPEYGDYLLLHPEEIDEAMKYAEDKDNYIVVSVHETEDGMDYIDMERPCDFGWQPYKYGYYVIEKSDFFV